VTLETKLNEIQQNTWSTLTYFPRLIEALRRSRQQRDKYLSEMMNENLGMDYKTKHSVPEDDNELLALLEKQDAKSA
jgi:hypothetical protein